MLVLRYAGLLALTVWVGGLVVLGGIAAPSTFDVLAARQAADHRALAGAVFGEALRRFHLVSYGCAAVVIATLLARSVLGPRPRGFAVRMAVAAVMACATLGSGAVVSPRISRLQAAIGVSPSSLAVSDPRRAAFGRLHAISTGLLFVPLLGGLFLLYRELKD